MHLLKSTQNNLFKCLCICYKYGHLHETQQHFILWRLLPYFYFLVMFINVFTWSKIHFSCSGHHGHQPYWHSGLSFAQTREDWQEDWVSPSKWRGRSHNNKLLMCVCVILFYKCIFWFFFSTNRPVWTSWRSTLGKWTWLVASIWGRLQSWCLEPLVLRLRWESAHEGISSLGCLFMELIFVCFSSGCVHRGRDVRSKRTEGSCHPGGLWDGCGKGLWHCLLMFHGSRVSEIFKCSTQEGLYILLFCVKLKG